ncbi:MAG: endonuclease/exonuclease/phosphatase family protein, partial [Acetobacteraceae bacterium]|nr:endonuclease/exonuclease/phosphatase family protein [Acetobacteraceae bacterium]
MIRLILLMFLLLPGLAAAAELKVATWNLEWLTARPAGDPSLPPEVSPKRPEDILRLRRYAEALNADVVALEEVDGPEMAAQIFPPDRYVLHFTNDRVVQRVGFAIRRGIDWVPNPDLAALNPFPAARHPLRSGADITLRFPGGLLRMLAVHLKTGCWQEPITRSDRPACEVLRTQIPALQGWIAQRQTEGAPFVLLGDFNRRMDGPEPVMKALLHAAPLLRGTEGRSNPCWGGAPFIDHIL